LLWILRALTMRRTSFILLVLAVLFAASIGVPSVHAVRTRGRVSPPEHLRTSHNKKKPAEQKVKARSKSRSAVARLRSVVLMRRHRARPRVQTEATGSEFVNQPAAVEDVSLPTTRRAMPLPLRGSYESLLRQNEKTEDDALERIEDDDDLADRIARKMLVPVPVSAALNVTQNLPENRRYCRPWTASFLFDLARAHATEFRHSLVVSSAVRTVEYQKQLMKVNGNATAAEGDVASPHLTGASIDIAKQGLTRQEIGWMRAWLLPLETAGKIDVEEEFRQSCFHITVYKSYVPSRTARKPAAQAAAKPSKTGNSGL
jgi:LAS superfamily LD-carboxypeptidase LdcB